MSDVTYWFNIWNRKLRLLTVSRRKGSNSWGPRRGDGRSQAYLVGSVSGREKEMNLANRKTLRMQKKKKKKSPMHVLKYFAVRAVSKGSVQKFTLWNLPLGWEIIKKTAKDKAVEQWVSSCMCLTIMRKIVVFGERRVLYKMPRQILAGNFLFSHTCGVLHHVKRHIRVYHSCTSQKHSFTWLWGHNKKGF